MNIVWFINGDRQILITQTNRSRQIYIYIYIYIYSFGCENYIKFVSMEIKSFDFREEKKNDERCV